MSTAQHVAPEDRVVNFISTGRTDESSFEQSLAQVKNRRIISMDNLDACVFPEVLKSIATETEALGFSMASEPKTGALLKTLAASKQNGRFLELGTGTGSSAAWILDGMDQQSFLVTVDNDSALQDVARKHLGHDPRIEFVCEDGGIWIEKTQRQQFDFIFADAWPGKFSRLDLVFNLLSVGGIYLVDDLLPQDSWPKGHASKVPALLEEIECKKGLVSVRIGWASGLMLVTKKNSSA